MRDRTVDRQFERFRTRGDVRALGDVFDATSDELLRVATSLTRDLVEAEDLLQATFVTAIERAKHWDSEQRLVPWLCGILVRHAHARRRERARVLDVERLEREPEREPNVAAEHVELERELDRALAGLSDDDREVLVKYLREGKEPIEIAREAHIAPGTARMRVHRGLERLRKLLPASFALGASALLGGRGLAAVRSEVVREATAASARLATGASISSTPILGGILVAKKLVAALVVFALLLVVVWWRGSSPAEPHSVPGAETLAAASTVEPDRTPIEAPSVAAETREPTERRTEDDGDAAYRRALSGLRGRVLGDDRTPRAGVEVALLETRAVDWFRDEFGDSSLSQAADAPRPELARTHTDAEGRFSFAGARPEAFHALGIALGRGNGAVHLLRDALRSGETLDLGDFVLPAGGTVRGRIVDDEGKPLAGVRVRAGEIAQPFVELGAAYLREGSLVLVRSEQGPKAVELPAWVAAYSDRLPLATARTDERGEFRLDDVVLGPVTLLADAPSRVATVVDNVSVSGAGDTDAGELVLSRGDRIATRVLDAAGAPVLGADVRIGVLHESMFGRLGILETARAASDGAYEAEGLDRTGEVWIAARRDDQEPWTLRAVERDDASSSVTLPALRAREFVVRDATGVGVRGAELALVPTVSALDPELRWLVVAGPKRASTDQDGRATFAAVPDGAFTLAITAPSGVRTRQELVFDAELAPRIVTLADGRALEFVVTDATTGAPVAKAEVSVASSDRKQPFPQRATTDGAGRASLAGVDHGDPKLAWSARIDHPAYGTTFVALDFERDVQECRLDPSGTVVARLVSEARGLADAVLVLAPQPRPRANPALGTDFRIVRFDGEGVARCDGLAPGAYRYELVEGLPSEIGASVLARIELPVDTLAAGGFAVESGREVELEITPRGEVRPAVQPRGATLTGTVTLDGRPGVGLEVVVYSQGADPSSTTTDGNGRFRVDGLAGARVGVMVSRPNRLREPETIGAKEFDLSREGVTDVELKWQTRVLVVTVRDDVTNEPVGDAEVICVGEGEAGFARQTTNRDGRATFRVIPSGAARLRCTKSGVGTALGIVALEPIASAYEAELRLEFAPRFAFRISFPAGVAIPESLWFWIVDASGVSRENLSYDPPRSREGKFAFETLPPGRYELRARGTHGEFEPIPFDLPATGATDFEFVLQPSVTPAAQR
ncbi:MAG: sigma-70 family RNA polymerase sigma factor [Planctomycetes bacterium]|nr:sigma-70 family RNA polymerase sigma factor [Planctomycetota bacterium]